MAQTPSNFQFATRGATTLFLWVAVLMTSSETLGQGTDPVWRVVQGQWEVTSLNGSIKLEWLDSNSSPLCERGGRTFNTVLDKETFIKFAKRDKSEGYTNYKERGDLGDPRVTDIVLYFDNLKPIYNFSFQFRFDNGYHTNFEGGSEGLLGSDLWFMHFGYVGYPRNSEDIVVRGRFETGTKWGGISIFSVTGSLVKNNMISGTWTFEEITAGPFPKLECRSRSKGSGTWVAVKK